MKTLLDEVGFGHRGAVVYLRKASNTRTYLINDWHPILARSRTYFPNCP
jgi:hypothetical protein